MSEATCFDEEVDLRGEVCPYTFIKSKLVLEDMEVGGVLRVIVDHLPAVGNVPRSMRVHGHQVLSVSRINETDWVILVKKGVNPFLTDEAGSRPA